MPTNKELEKRVAVLEGMVEAMQKTLDTSGTSIENLKVGLEDIKKMDVQVRNIVREEPYISLEWFPETRVWVAQLGNNAAGLYAVSVAHDTAAQAFQILLQKLQRKVSL
jgi:hypothetical protein